MKYYRMKIDKQGKTQKKQSKKNYRKTQKGGLDFGIGKSNRGKVENTIHQLDKIIKHTAKDTKKAAVHMQRFKDAFNSIDDTVKSSIRTIFTYDDNIPDNQFNSNEGAYEDAITSLLKIIHGEMKQQVIYKRFIDKFDSPENHMFKYVDDGDDGDKFSSNVDNRNLISTTIQNQKDNDVIAVIKGEIESSQAAQGGKKTQKKRKRKRKRKRRKTASKK